MENCRGIFIRSMADGCISELGHYIFRLLRLVNVPIGIKRPNLYPFFPHVAGCASETQFRRLLYPQWGEKIGQRRSFDRPSSYLVCILCVFCVYILCLKTHNIHSINRDKTLIILTTYFFDLTVNRIPWLVGQARTLFIRLQKKCGYGCLRRGWATKKPRIGIRSFSRREGDSNPRYSNPVRQFSKLLVSATHPSLLFPIWVVQM